MNNADCSGTEYAAYPVMPQELKLAHAYVPFQYFENVYPPEQGLAKGTIFPGLDRPYGLDPEYLVDQ